jgi:PTS system fructose-specific IIA component
MNSAHSYAVVKQTILLDLYAKTKLDAIHSLCGHLFMINKTDNPSHLYQDIVEREKIVSTFAGAQTAIPHAITKHVSESFLCFARISNDDFIWNGNDEKVRFILLLSEPAQSDLKKLRQSQSYIYSSIANLISMVETIRLWEAAKDEQVILDCLNNAFKACKNTEIT